MIATQTVQERGNRKANRLVSRDFDFRLTMTSSDDWRGTENSIRSSRDGWIVKSPRSMSHSLLARELTEID